MDKQIIDDAITVVVPDGVDRKILSERIANLINELKLSNAQKNDKEYSISFKVPSRIDKDRIAKEFESLCSKMYVEYIEKEYDEKIKRMSLEDALKEIKYGNKDSFVKIIQKSPLFEDNIMINVITKYYALFWEYPFSMNKIVADEVAAIFAFNISKLILGLLLNIPPYVLRALRYKVILDDHTSKWINEELEYYDINNSYRIENLIDNVPNDAHPIIKNYFRQNHYDHVKNKRADLLTLSTKNIAEYGSLFKSL